MGNCCAGEYDLHNKEDLEGNSIKSQPSMDYLHRDDRNTKSTADGSKGLRNTNLSIDIPVAWEYEPVMVNSHGGQKIDLRAHIENKMVDY